MVTARSPRRSALLLAPALLLACKPAEPQALSPTPAAMTPAPQPASEPGPAAEPVAPAVTTPAVTTPAATEEPKGETYLACGCGCCGGAGDADMKPAKQCLDRKQGETLARIRAADEEARKDPQCATMGCSLGTEYSYCD